MPVESFRELLSGWIGKEVIVINPESIRMSGALESVGFETYSARIAAVRADYIEIAFQAQNRGRLETVESFIPLDRIKRVSLWGDSLHLIL